MNHYVIKTGDIIRVMDERKNDYEGNSYFHTNVDENGKYTAHSMNGYVAPSYPLDTISYVKTQGSWWRVLATYCEMEDIAANGGAVSYDLEPVEPCISRGLERELSARSQG